MPYTSDTKVKKKIRHLYREANCKNLKIRWFGESKTDQKLWEPFGFDESIIKIRKNLEEISILAKSINADFYIIIYPWPDTLEYGQNKFNWEEFAVDLCNIVSCTKLINLFPEFRHVKETSTDWLTKLYIEDDVHLVEYAQKIVATKILEEAF